MPTRWPKRWPGAPSRAPASTSSTWSRRLPDYPLFPQPNAILTPHLAWYSEDAARTIRELIVLEIDRFLAGQPPRYVAKPAV